MKTPKAGEQQDVDETQAELGKGFETPADQKAARALAKKYRQAIVVHGEATKDLKAARDEIRDFMEDKDIAVFKHDGRIYKLQPGEPELVIEKVADPKRGKGGSKSMQETVSETEDGG